MKSDNFFFFVFVRSTSSPSLLSQLAADQSEVLLVCFPFSATKRKKAASQLGGKYKTVTKTNLAELFLPYLLFKSDRQGSDSVVSGTLFSMAFFKPGLKIAHLYVLTCWGGEINNIFCVMQHGITSGVYRLHGS